MKNCIVCGKLTTLTCQLCKTTYYCSKEHQKQDWTKRHKLMCSGNVASVRAEPTSSNSESEKKNANSVAKSRLTPSKVEHNVSTNKAQPTRRQLFTQPSSIVGQSDGNIASLSPVKLSLAAQKPTVEEISARADHFLQLDERRKQQRRTLVLEYVRAKEETLVARCTSLLKLSKQIEGQFSSDLTQFLFRQYRVRTSKLLQKLEYVLDAAYLAKLLLKQGDRERLKQLLFQLEMPELPQRSEPTTSQLNQPDLEGFKTYRLEVQSYRRCISLLASISNAAGFVNFTERLYSRYIILLEDSSGINEQFVGYYMVALWYSEIGQHNKAIKCFEHCLNLKDQNRRFEPEAVQDRPSEMLVGNCHYNIALCQRILNQVPQSLDSMLRCLSIRRQQPANNKLELADCLEFVAKQLMEQNKIDQGIDYLNECHRVRLDLLKSDDPALLRVKELVRLLYRQAEQNSRQASSMQQADTTTRTVNRLTEIIRRDYPEIETYIDKLRKNQKTQLNIKIDLEWFKDMKPQELESFAEIVRLCQELPADKAAAEFFESKFYTSLSPERKEAVKQLNPPLQSSI